MLNNKENTLPTWIFFSNVDATLVNESARQLLVWSGESFGRLLRSTENILNALMSNDHRLTRESVVELGSPFWAPAWVPIPILRPTPAACSQTASWFCLVTWPSYRRTKYELRSRFRGHFRSFR